MIYHYLKRHINFILLSLFFAVANGQDRSLTSSSLDIKKPLTEEEVKLGTALYEAMVKTETYKTNNEYILYHIDMLNGVKLLSIEEMIEINNSYGNDPEIIQQKTEKILTKNIGKTKFKSVKEAMEVYKKSIELQEKQIEENKKLYDLMSRATVSQIREIIAPGRRNFYDILYENRNLRRD